MSITSDALTEAMVACLCQRSLLTARLERCARATNPGLTHAQVDYPTPLNEVKVSHTR